MRRVAERWVRAVWAGRGGVAGALARVTLWPLELVFRAGVALRSRRFDREGREVARAPVPVVSVGNLSVGGTGKTPVAAWVAAHLLGEGRRPCLVSRGYGADELALHRRWNPRVPVHADPLRVRAVEAGARGGCDVAVVDDGFQHRQLARELDLVVVGAEQGLPGALLPRGPFREPLPALRRAHGVVVTRKSAAEEDAAGVVRAVQRVVPDLPVGRVWLAPRRLVPLPEWSGTDPGRHRVTAGPVTVATSVANPASVVGALERIGVAVSELRAFPDHHDFTDRDAAALARDAVKQPLVVTEKDAVKLERFPELREGRVLVLVLEQELTWEAGREAITALLDRLPGYPGGGQERS